MVSINLEEPKLLTSTRFYAIFYFPEVAMLHTAEKKAKKDHSRYIFLAF